MINASQNIKGWIDFDNNGDFTEDEFVFEGSESFFAQEIDFILPHGEVYNVPIRMRVISSLNEVESSCPIDFIGQTCDYRVVILPTDLAPQTDFSADATIVHVGESVSFTDLSVNAPSNWEWNFPGGEEDNSNIQNPVVVYNDVGFYDVSLITSNANGNDEIVKSEYIEVRNPIVMCSDQQSNSMFGIMYDSGGLNGNYGPNEYCSLLLSPECADQITLTFEEFELDYCCDYITIYDGIDNNGIELLNVNDYNTPSPIVANSGNMYIEFSSSSTGNYPGWVATWEAIELEDESFINFETDASVALINQDIQFTDLSDENVTEWFWDFGDGNYSSLQNPIHSYLNSGSYTVLLNAGNCLGFGSFDTTIIVQNPASISLSTSDTLQVQLDCGATDEVYFTIYNTGETNLEIEIGEADLSFIKDFNLCFFSGEESYLDSAFFDVMNDIQGLNRFNFHYSQDPEYFNFFLNDIDVLIYTEYYLSNNEYGFISPVVSNYIESGGRAILFSPELLIEMNLIEDVWGFNNGDSTFINIPNHNIMDGLSSIDPDGIAGIQGLNIDEVEVLSSLYYSDVSKPSIFTTSIEQGEIVFLPLLPHTSIFTPIYTFYPDQARLIRNSIKYFTNQIYPPFLASSELSSSQVLLPGDSLVVSLNLNAIDLSAGVYYASFPIFSNDLVSDSLNYDVQITISGIPDIEVNSSELDFEQGYIGETYQDTLIVHNPSCVPLELSTDLSHPEFSVSQSSLVIDAYNGDTLLINYSPIDVGSDSAVLEINSNAGLFFIDLAGSAELPPNLSASITDTLYIPVFCMESGTTDFKIYNDGDSDLEVNVNSQVVNGSVKVVVIIPNYPDTPQYLNAKEPFISSTRLVEVVEVSYADLYDIENELIDADILVVAEGTTVYNYLEEITTDFVAAGGQLLVNFGEMNEFSFLNTFSDYNYFAPSSYYHIEDSGNPITDGIPEYFLSENYSATIEPQYQENSEVYCTRGGNIAVSSLEYGDGLVYYYGFAHTYQSLWDSLIYQNIINLMLEDSSPEQVVLESTNVDDIIIAGDSLVINFNYNAEQLYPGHHYGDITVQSNDPDSPSISYVYDLHIIGQTILEVDESEIDFGSFFIGTEPSQSLVVYNQGCDTLFIETQIEGSDFFITQDLVQVLPYSQDTISMIFSPVNVGFSENELTIVSNNINLSIPLTGTAIEAPELSINFIDTLHVTVVCDEYAETTFTIYNTGLHDLNLSPGMSAFDSSYSVLILKTFAGESIEYSNFISTFESIADNYILSESMATNSEQLTNDLIGKQLLIIPEQQGNTSEFMSEISDAVFLFRQNGGDVFSLGNPYVEDLIGFASNTEPPANFLGMSVLSWHPFVDGIEIEIPQINSTHYLTDLIQQIEILIYENSSNHKALVYEVLNGSYFVYCGFDFEEVNETNSRIVENVYNFLFEPINPSIENYIENSSWLSEEVIPPGDSLVVTLNFEDSLLVGDYYYTLPVFTNDPLWNSDFVFHVEMVEDSPTISLDDSPIEFGQVLLGDSETIEILIQNNSCGPLLADGSLMTENFSLYASTVYFPAYDSRLFYLKFEPTTAGFLVDTLFIDGIGGNFTVPISGECVEDENSSILKNRVQSFKIYPNPSSGTFVIKYGDNRRIKEIQILNVLGQAIDYEVLNSSNDLIELEIQNPVAGIYIVKGENEAGIQLESRMVIF